MSDQERDNIRDLLETLHHDVREIKTVLVGDYEKRGLITRVTALEQTERDRRCWYRLTIGAALTSAIGAIVSWLKHGGA